ncbi:hypothetical protein BXZ70DRAFT_1003223 [Cristinia sonorae]|uniref:Uncharacterized protein n=1 Tax=Cristinia sonorae TaxID=1940300 RepID=A0A8K0UXR5_9AGAR|nr:hypothetical protein BXZ70DRAFT_1003223 [Cristinia sonorae]
MTDIGRLTVPSPVRATASVGSPTATGSASPKSPKPEYETLSDPEALWRNHYSFLHDHGLQLRSRYKEGWMPSWDHTDKDPKQCDDGPPRLAPIRETANH